MQDGSQTSKVKAVLVATLLAAVLLVLNSPANTAGAMTPIRHRSIHLTVAGKLLRWQKALQQDGLVLAAQLAVDEQLQTWGDTVLVEALGYESVWGQAGIAALTAAGAEVVVRGQSVLLVRIQAADLERIAAVPALRWLRPVIPPVPLEVVGEGAALIGVTPFVCTGKTGKGQRVAILDVGFAGYPDLVASGEVPKPPTWPDPGGSSHGSACAEIAAEVAASAGIVPVAIPSVAHLEAWIRDELPASGVTVISHSLGWPAASFGDGTGPACNAVTAARVAGVSFVTAAGNANTGTIWHGLAKDADGDKYLEFVNKNSYNSMKVETQGTLVAFLDWDDYPASDTDLALELLRVEGAWWTTAATANDPQTGSQPPVEWLSYANAVPGHHAWRIRHVSGPLPSAVRLDVTYGGIELEHFVTERTLLDPAVCVDAITVAAVSVGKWPTGEVASFSSRGPTWDGRTKPDLAAPSGVASSSGYPFSGTSAAAPHVAGAMAILQATGLSPEQARLELFATAIPPAGQTVPDSVSGYGRVRLRTGLSGALCDPADPTKVPCKSSCGSDGQGRCGADCESIVCTPPVEACDGQDQDCDGQTDEDFPCALGTTQPCTLPCGGTGVRGCGQSCSWEPCIPAGEVCNGLDDDCNNAADEGFACRVGAFRDCTAKGGEAGGTLCTQDCTWGPCEVLELCNGMDDDSDGTIDEGACGSCSASPVHSGEAGSWAPLILVVTSLLVPRRRHAQSTNR